MKHIVSMALLIIHSVQSEMVYSPSFPQLKDSEYSIQEAQETFSITCEHNWKILTAINMSTAAPFPVELFALNVDPGFNISVKCSTDRKSMNVTFLVQSCALYGVLAENPIVFQIDQNKLNSSEVHFQLISSCIHKSNASIIDTANIGHVNDTIWYLVHVSIIDSGKYVRFGLIVFGQYEEFNDRNYQKGVNSAYNHIGENLLSSQLTDILPNKIPILPVDCALISCYNLNPNQSLTTFTTETNNGKMKKLVFLLILVIVGIFLLGMIIICRM